MILLEISFYAFLTSFCVVKGMALFDFLMDYNHYWWKLRYHLAHRAAKKVDMQGFLESSLDQAKSAGDEGVNVMASAYSEIAGEHYPFKLWTCIYCMTLRFGLFAVLAVCALLVFQGYGWYTAAYFFTTIAGISWLLKV